MTTEAYEPSSSQAALAHLRAILASDEVCDDDLDNYTAARALLMDRDDIDANRAYPELLVLVDTLNRGDRSELALDMSLCPLHLVDYAICFDDDDPECAAIREVFPSHDT